MTILSIVLIILFFGVLIAVHEFGHFIAAKSLGVRVEEFAIGMGPKLFSRKKGETTYSLRALPIGGFCAMEGEEENSDDPRSFSNKPAWKKLIILVAGAFMNFVAGLVIIVLLFSVSGVPSLPVVNGYLAGAEDIQEQGLLPGDEFYSINGHRIYLGRGSGGGAGRPAGGSGHSPPALPHPHRRERPAGAQAGHHRGPDAGYGHPGHTALRLVPGH